MLAGCNASEGGWWFGWGRGSLGKEVSLQGWDQTLLEALQLPRAARQEQGEAPVLCREEKRVDVVSRACSARAGAD